MHVISNAQLAFLIKDVNFIADYVVQEFIPPEDAQEGDYKYVRHPASMRLLMDFRYLEDGTIAVDFKSAYQRIATESAPKRPYRASVEKNEAYIVSKSKGAYSAPASAEETSMATEAAEAIIKRLAEGYKQDQKRKTAGL